MTPDEVRRILVVQTAFLGDVLLTTPLLAALRRIFPQSHLAFLGTLSGCALLSGLSGVDEFLSYDKRGAEAGVAGLRRKARELKAANFDLALAVHRSLRTALLLSLAAIRQRIGFAVSPVPWLYSERRPWEPAKHEVERNLELLTPLGGIPPDFEPRLFLPPMPPAGEELLPTAGNGPRIALCPGSVWPTKRWPASAFARLAQALHAEFGAQLYLTGAKEDEGTAVEVAALAGSGVINLAGKTSLSQWIQILAAMDLIITNDSAPTHLASALGVPVVVIYGPTTPGQGFGPWRVRSAVVETEGLACRPCGRHGPRRCPEGHFRCMRLISAEKVLAAAAELLDGER